jgi:hypothetical protein
MPRIGIGLGLGLFGGSIDAQAQAHYNRVIADGGVVPAGVSGVNGFFNAVKTIYATSDITTAISVGLDAHYLGYKLGAGSGTTLGQAAQKLYSCAGSSGDVVQTTAASQPLLLAHNGASSDNYWWGSGVSNNYVSTPNASANEITGDIEFIANIDFKSNGTLQWIVSKGNGGAPYNLDFGINNVTPFFQFNSTLFPATTTIAASFVGYLKVTRVASSGVIQFFTSTDGTTYTQLGTNVSSTAGSITTNSLPLYIGRYSNAAVQFTFANKIYRATISNSIGGAPVVDFNPATYNASTSQTQWTSTTGEVWTINTGTAGTGYKGALVDRTIVISDGVDDSLRSSTISLARPLVYYVGLKTFINSYSPTQYFLDGNGDDVNRLSFGTNVQGVSNRGALWTSYDTDQLALLTSGYINGVLASYIDYNNVNKAIGSQADNPTMTALTIFKPGSSASNYANYNLNTLVISSLNDSSGIKTSMYNYIRTINNNAF